MKINIQKTFTTMPTLQETLLKILINLARKIKDQKKIPLIYEKH